MGYKGAWVWQNLGPVLGWDSFWKKWFSEEFLKRNEVGTSQIGVERQKEPDVTGLPAQSLEGVREEDKRKRRNCRFGPACATTTVL